MKYAAVIMPLVTLLVATSTYAEPQVAIEAKIQARLDHADRAVVKASNTLRADPARACSNLRDAFGDYDRALDLVNKNRALIAADQDMSEEARQEQIGELDSVTQTMRDQQKQVQGMLVRNCYNPM